MAKPNIRFILDSHDITQSSVKLHRIQKDFTSHNHERVLCTLCSAHDPLREVSTKPVGFKFKVHASHLTTCFQLIAWMYQSGPHRCDGSKACAATCLTRRHSLNLMVTILPRCQPFSLSIFHLNICRLSVRCLFTQKSNCICCKYSRHDKRKGRNCAFRVIWITHIYTPSDRWRLLKNLRRNFYM